MKIHIDTATEQKKAKKTGNTAKEKKTSPAQPTRQSPDPPASTPKKKPNLPKSPPKEPKSPADVKAARKQQTQVLKQRQGRETQGKAFGSRDIDAGSGFWPPLSPLL